MENVVIIAVLVLIVAGILFYLHRAKGRGEACIGCPHAKACRGKDGAGCGCGQGPKTD